MSKIANSVITMRVSAAKKQLWEAKAKEAGMSLSAWIDDMCSRVYTNQSESKPESRNVYTYPEPDKSSLHSVISRLGTLR